MKAVEFETELTGDSIQIPENFQMELSLSKDKHVRVILLIDDLEINEEKAFKNLVRDNFLSGFDETDAVYDNL